MAEDRKARLAALAARAGRNNNKDNQGDESIENVEANSEVMEKKTIQVRNYAPKDESLDETIEEPSSKRLRQTDDDDGPKKEEKSELEKALLEAKVDAAKSTRDDQLVNGGQGSGPTIAAPKKVNWDLKRDIAKKMNRLERRTQKAVVELLRLRLEREAEAEEDANDLD